jgi:polysaccharide pyruvyl transferase CsaB
LLVSLLQVLPPHIQPVVLSADPRQTSQRYGVESCPGRSPIPILHALRSADVFIWGGGSLMQDATSLGSPLYYGGLMALAQVMGLKTIAWGQGVGPLKRPFTRWLTRRVLKNCIAISVRDRASAQLLANWKLSPLMAPDPVWTLESRPLPGLWDLPAPRVAVNLRSHPSLTPQRLAILTEALVSFQKATQTCILLVPFQRSHDLAIAEAIAPHLSGACEILEVEDPRELKGVFRGVEMAIGMRLHSLIMAAAEEAICFALSYDPKVTRLMEELEMPGWELDALPVDPNAISTAWLNVYANGDRLNPAQISSLRDRASIHGELLSNLTRIAN